MDYFLVATPRYLLLQWKKREKKHPRSVKSSQLAGRGSHACCRREDVHHEFVFIGHTGS